MDEEKFIANIKRYARLRYSHEKICQILGLSPEDSAKVITRLENPEDPLHIAYAQGVAIGDYHMDKMLEKAGKEGNPLAISELSTRQYHRRQDELKKEMFGV